MNKTILTYSSGSITARTQEGRSILLQGLSFTLHEGESMALIGETGSGKTMTALSLMGLLPENVKQTNSRITLDGKNLQSAKDFDALRGREMVYIPQNGLESLNPARRIDRQFADAPFLAGKSADEKKTAILEKLALAGFDKPEEICRLYPHQLSGGMAQRVTIALSMSGQARLVLADEPTNGLDEAGKADFLSLLKQCFPRSAILIITHDMSLATLCDSCMVLCGGRAMEYAPGAELFTNPRHPYTLALLGALVKQGLQQTPTLRRETALCPFYGRCKKAKEQCKESITHQKDAEREWWCNDAPAS